MFNKSKEKNNGHKEIITKAMEQSEQLIDELTEEEVDGVWDELQITVKQKKEIVKHALRRK